MEASSLLQRVIGPRERTFVSLAFLVAAVGFVAAMLHLATGDFRRLGWSSLVVLDAVLALVALRVRVSLTWVASCFFGAGLILVSFAAMDLGTAGVPMSFWLSMVAIVLVPFFIALVYELETAGSISALETQNRALAEARAEADRASRAKSEFISTISHEIRTPLNGVTGVIALLANERDPGRIRDGLRIVQQSADTLLAVVNDVLDLSKIEANRLDLEAVPVSLRDEFRLVVDLMRPRADERRNHLELTIEDEVPAWVRGDSTRLRQVMLNLVSNAIKFTSDGRVSCHLRGTSGQLVFEVSDTGVGIEPAVLGRLFRPFSQADASTTRRYGGTGLGLFIAHRLVEAMGGSISVASTVGVGSVFTVRVPLEATEARCEAPDVAVVADTPMHILLVEDNAINQLVARRLIEQLGHQVSVAVDGKQALRECETLSFDLILMDCHMPEMDGFEATRQLRERGDQTPIVALSAAVSLDDRLRCFEVGMNATLSKPLRYEQLKALLDGLSAMRSKAA
jgi:signal transduction histidine kinase/ActR/RegA family two-component response regulator